MAATVAEIMDADAPTVAPETGVEQVWRLMRESEVTGLPVVNAGGRCVGIVTENDLVIADEEGELRIPHYLELLGGLVFLEPLRHLEAKLKKASAATAEQLMSEDPVTVEADAPVREAARLIAAKHHNRLPVVEHGRYVGLVTRADVVAALADAG
jgi:CBS domain-containing protein